MTLKKNLAVENRVWGHREACATWAKALWIRVRGWHVLVAGQTRAPEESTEPYQQRGGSSSRPGT